MSFSLIASVYKKLMLNYVYLIEPEIVIYLVIGSVTTVTYGNPIILHGCMAISLNITHSLRKQLPLTCILITN